MKLIIAIIRPERLDPVQTALKARLDEADHYRITVQPVDGHGRHEGQVEYFRGQPVRPKLVRKTQITIAVNDPYVEPAIEAILSGARSDDEGAVGDGKIFVVPLEECIRIRTGERGTQAI
jgi:nitrogen regulatory protein P-II 1